MGKPPLYDLVNSMYHSVMDKIPHEIQRMDMGSAFMLGFAGSYSLLSGFQWISRHTNFIERVIWEFHRDIQVPLEKLCALTMTAVPLAYSMIDPDSAKQLVTQHPVYTSGMAGVYSGIMTAILKDINERAKSVL